MDPGTGLGSLGKALVWAGIGLAALGGILLLAARFGFPRLPGDVVVERKNFTFYAPFGLMILLSLVLTLLFNLFSRR